MSKYRVILTGKLRDGVARDSIIKAACKSFNIDRKTAEKAFSGGRVTIRGGLDKETAERYQAALTKIGAMSVVEPMGSRASTPTATSTPAPAPASPAATKPKPPSQATTSDAVPAPEPDPRGLKFEIDARPDFAFLTVQIPAGETLKVEASAMATMDTNLVMKTKLRGGFGRFITGESIFINEFTAEGGGAEIGIAPGPPGDLIHRYLDGDTIYMQNSAFVACTPNIAVESKWQGLIKGFFSGESLFLIRCHGTGDLWFNSYGAVIDIPVDGDYVVDTSAIVAFTEGLDYKIRKVGGYKSLFFSGEGLVCRFSGQGKVWIQSREAFPFVWWAHPFRPVQKSKSD